MKNRTRTKKSRSQTKQRRVNLKRKADAAVDDPRFDADPRVAATALKAEAEAKRAKGKPATEGSADAT